jgi:hypothetical protein
MAVPRSGYTVRPVIRCVKQRALNNNFSAVGANVSVEIRGEQLRAKHREFPQMR